MFGHIEDFVTYKPIDESFLLITLEGTEMFIDMVDSTHALKVRVIVPKGAVEEAFSIEKVTIREPLPCPMCGEMAAWYKDMSSKQRLCKTTDCPIVTFTEVE